MPSFPFLASPTQEIWRAVTFDLGIPYTFINHAREHKGIWIAQCSVYWRQEDVLELCHQIGKDPRSKILDVWLLQPYQEGSHGSWKWVGVNEILVGEVKHSPSAWPYYLTADGELIQGGRSDILEKQDKLKKVFVRGGSKA